MTGTTGMASVGSCEAEAAAGETMIGTTTEATAAAGEEGASTRGVEGDITGCGAEAVDDAPRGTPNLGGGPQVCIELGVRTGVSGSRATESASRSHMWVLNN